MGLLLLQLPDRHERRLAVRELRAVDEQTRGGEGRMRILGIDPGSAIMGFGVIDSTAGKLTHVAHGTLRPPRSLQVAERLCFLYDGVVAVIRDHQPEVAAVEQVFVSISPRSALVLGQARGVALAALGSGEIPVSEYSASRIKQSTTGNGRAAKAQIQNMIQRLLVLDRRPCVDAADALAAAICHAHVARVAHSTALVAASRISNLRIDKSRIDNSRIDKTRLDRSRARRL